MGEIKRIIQKLKEFRDERDWEQFHDKKNLALALSIEASELNEHFLWKEKKEFSQINKEVLEEELADILSYAFLFAEKCNIDIVSAIEKKIEKNKEKYPVEKSKGVSTKYNKL